MISELTLLDNGLPVVLVDTQSFPTVTTLILVGAGSRYETPENNGVAHFFEHMAFKGSLKYPDSYTISSKIEGLGGYFNAFTSKDHTGYWVKAPKHHFEEVIDVLSDMILHPLLLPEEIEREKGVIVEEINMYEDMPARKVSDIFDDILFKGHPLSYDIAGTPTSVRSFTRKTFTSYIDTHYHPRNAVVVVAGGLSGKEGKDEKSAYLDIIKKRFIDWKPRTQHVYESFVDTQKKKEVMIKYKKTEQAHFSLGFKAFPFSDPRRYALTLLSTILGGGMSSRLFMEVREKRGLCYYISTGRELYADTGYMVTQAGVTNNLSKLEEAVKATLDQHTEMAKGNITDEEIVRAKEMLKGRLLLSLEDSYDVASFVGNRYLLEEHIVYPEQVVEKIEAVTKSDIVAVAKELFVPEKLNIAVIGPFKGKTIKVDF
jgi:predicted Zn-dependent peptidase